MKEIHIPETAGVYFIWAGGVCVYVGTSKNIRKRVLGGHEIQSVIRECDEITWIECCECGRRNLERFFIQHFRPKLNRLWVVPPKPAKKYKYLSLSPHTYAAILDYSNKTGIPMNRIVDDMATDWLTCVAPARLEAMRPRNTLSQFEKKG